MFICLQSRILCMGVAVDGMAFGWLYESTVSIDHDDVIKWKHFPHYWPFVRGIHQSPVNSPHKGQWRRALMFCLICAWKNGWVKNREAVDLRCHRTHYDVIVMRYKMSFMSSKSDLHLHLSQHSAICLIVLSSNLVVVSLPFISFNLVQSMCIMEGV